MNRLILSVLLVALFLVPARAVPVINVGPWFITAESLPAGPQISVGQAGPVLGMMAQCYTQTASIAVWGTQRQLRLSLGRQVQMRVLVDNAVMFELTGIAVVANRVEFVVDSDVTLERMRHGQGMVLFLTDADGQVQTQGFTLNGAAAALRQLAGAGCVVS
jgi:hypothetical protein